MAFQKLLHAIFLLALLGFFVQASASSASTKKSYIVYMGVHPHGSNPSELDSQLATDSHHQFLASFLGSHEKAKDAIIYSYNKHINGFSAILDDEEAAEIRKHSKVVSVFLDKPKKLHTTHSWEFLGLSKNDAPLPHALMAKARFGEDSIIANLDTGVWPESASFDDVGYGPVPHRYNGPCDNGGTDFKCNRKLIGARFYYKGYLASNNTIIAGESLSPRDTEGHGSHTLSTVGGAPVVDANVLGVGNGTAVGGSPRARVAAYKVCWKKGCMDSDILAGFDDAIHDGVDVISVSLGGDVNDYFQDATAIGAFHAVRRGVHVICSAGNDGPSPGTVTNIAPWIFTIGASTIDREFQAFVQLGNGQRFKGTSVSVPLPNFESYYPLISGEKAKFDNASALNASLCLPGTLDPSKASGKIVACLRGVNSRVDKGMQAYLAGAVGFILCNDKGSGNELISDPHFIPASHINYEDGVKVLAYINSTQNPKAILTPSRSVIHTKPAPAVASFSSRGPNILDPQILKPDIAAPGVNIIAAYTEAISPTEEDGDNRRVPFITMSGTSMACPHVSGVIGLLKTLFPYWSPAAARSALMTSARTRDNTMSPMTDQSTNTKTNPFAHGSGHINPNRAMNPGLIYDLHPTEYLQFLCALGYNQTTLAPFLEPGQDFSCGHQHNTLRHFNYPSFSVPRLPVGHSYTMKRRVTNVGLPGTYKVSVRHPAGAKISVSPSSLTFERFGEVKAFRVRVEGEWSSGGYVFGGITWSDGKHYVRSPVAVNVS